MLEELGVPYKLEMLPFPPRVLSRQFLDINPLGTVPALFDGAVGMTESAAICQYLAARYSPRELDVDLNEAEFGAYLNFLHFGEATLTFPQTLVLRYSRFEVPERQLPRVADDYSKWFLARLRALEPRLAGRPYVCGRFTAADVSIGYALLLAQHLGLDNFTPSVKEYWTRLTMREGFARAMSAQATAAIAQGVSTTPSPNLSPPQKG